VTANSEKSNNGARATLAFEDTGAGVAPEHEDRLFTPFFTTKEPGKGTGMGLAVSQSIVREHDGEITFSTNASGSRFVVAIPMASSEIGRNMSADPGNSSVHSGNATILVVDDDHDMVAALCDILRQAGYQTMGAHSGDEAVAIVEREIPDVLISDLRMAGMTGHGLQTEVKRLAPNLPVIIITAFGLDSDRGRIDEARRV